RALRLRGRGADRLGSVDETFAVVRVVPCRPGALTGGGGRAREVVGLLSEAGADLGRVQLRIGTAEQGRDAGDVRRRHRRTTEKPLSAANMNAQTVFSGKNSWLPASAIRIDDTFTPGATPTIPMPFFAPAIVPATCVPCSPTGRHAPGRVSALP